jgi:hypothetical protein
MNSYDGDSCRLYALCTKDLVLSHRTSETDVDAIQVFNDISRYLIDTTIRPCINIGDRNKLCSTYLYFIHRNNTNKNRKELI